MQEEPLFSIIVATYNQANLLKICLDSIESQTFGDWEAIIVNNHSTDNTSDVVASYKDPRLKEVLVHNEGVLSVSRNVGIKSSSGKWICMLDSDDVWYDKKLEMVYGAINANPQMDVISHYLVLRNMNTDETELMRTPAFSNNGIYLYLLKHGNIFPQTSLCYKKEFMDNYNLLFDESKDFVTSEDYDFSLRLALAGAKFYCIKTPLGEWRQYKNNWSSSPKHLGNLENMLRHQVFEVQNVEDNHEGLWKDVYTGLVIRKAVLAFHQRQYLSGFGGFLKALFKCPNRLFRYISDRLTLAFSRSKYKRHEKI